MENNKYYKLFEHLSSEHALILLDSELQEIFNIVLESENNSKIDDLEIRQCKFKDKLIGFIPTYGDEFINDFYDYWSEPNKSKTKFRYELQKTWDSKKRLETWKKNSKKTYGNTTEKPFAGRQTEATIISNLQGW